MSTCHGRRQLFATGVAVWGHRGQGKICKTDAVGALKVNSQLAKIKPSITWTSGRPLLHCVHKNNSIPSLNKQIGLHFSSIA